MFTGLIQSIGTLEKLSTRGDEAELLVSAAFEGMELGESIAVMGACLTVTVAEPGRFTAFASQETLAKTGLKELGSGAPVNVERALKVGDPIGGHIVTGHVDARVRLLERVRYGEAERFSIALPESPLLEQVAAKGSVAIDGVSLTVNDVRKESFDIMIIPLTLGSTTLDRLRPGDAMNIETDVLAKYVARQLGRGGEGGGGVDMDLLMRSGFVR
ncbi:MAG: riboflavin synthase [Deltaproteobacteria bacterium]|nr:riboflavin synthase [Deltaproteobacteria bacterium]